LDTILGDDQRAAEGNDKSLHTLFSLRWPSEGIYLTSTMYSTTNPQH